MSPVRLRTGRARGFMGHLPVPPGVGCTPPPGTLTQMPQKATRPSHDEIVSQDIRDLERLGYAQQLFREMGGFSNFAISFSIISVLTGAVLLYCYVLKLAWPVINTVGWPLVSVFT